MDLGLKGKLALVTGSSEGIGRAVAEELLREGARVIVTGRSEAKLEVARAKLASLGELHVVGSDLATSEGATALVRSVAEVGDLDILVNNVGFFEVRPFVETTDEQWQSMLEINLMSGVRLARAFLPTMLERGEGRVVFVSSEQANRPNPEMLHYAVAKTAQVALSRGLAELTRSTRVTVNSVIVAPTWTEGVETFLEPVASGLGRSVEEMRSAYFDGDGYSSLIRRFAEPSEIAAEIAFLCSARASAINGAARRVDGGVVRSLF